MSRPATCILLILAGLALVGWFVRLGQAAMTERQLRYGAVELRAATARRAQGPLRIGLAAPLSQPADRHLLQGALLALEQINAGGGVLGRQLALVEKDDQGEVARARQVAQEFAEDPDVPMVIGHRASPTTLATAMSYEYHGILLVSPTATSLRLTQLGYRRVLRTTPSDETLTAAMAALALRRGWNRVLVSYVDDDFGRGLTSAIERRGPPLGLTILDRIFHEAEDDPALVAEELVHQIAIRAPSALILAGRLPQSAKVIKALRANGANLPILAGTGLDGPELVALAGPAACGVYLATVFDPLDPDPRITRFVDDYRRRWGMAPERLAAQGYDTLQLLAEAVRRAGSSEPDQVATAVKAVRGWRGLTGTHDFFDNGDVVKPVRFKTLVDPTGPTWKTE